MGQSLQIGGNEVDAFEGSLTQADSDEPVACVVVDGDNAVCSATQDDAEPQMVSDTRWLVIHCQWYGADILCLLTFKS